MTADPRAALGVKHDAARGEIRRANRRLARKPHPNLNPDDRTAEERFEQLTPAERWPPTSWTRSSQPSGGPWARCVFRPIQPGIPAQASR
jgi:DnaJ domain